MPNRLMIRLLPEWLALSFGFGEARYCDKERPLMMKLAKLLVRAALGGAVSPTLVDAWTDDHGPGKYQNSGVFV